MGCGASQPSVDLQSSGGLAIDGAGPANNRNEKNGVKSKALSPKVAGTGSPPADDDRRLCEVCKQECTDDYVEAVGKVFHTAHFKCGRCNKQLEEEFFESEDVVVMCGECNASEMPCAKCGLPILEEFITAGGKQYHVDCIGEPCGRCGKTVVESVVKALKQSWHPDCFTCALCHKALKDGFSELNKELVCPSCKQKALSDKYSSAAGVGAHDAPQQLPAANGSFRDAPHGLPPLRETRSLSYANLNRIPSEDVPTVSPAMVGPSLPSSPQRPPMHRALSSPGMPTPYAPPNGRPAYSPMPNRRPSSDQDNGDTSPRSGKSKQPSGERQGDIASGTTVVSGSDSGSDDDGGGTPGQQQQQQHTPPPPQALTKSGLDFEIPFEDLYMDLQIGSGAFGVVWKGRWRASQVAIKMLPTHLMNKKEIRAFQAEAALMKNLRPAPNVVLLLGVCTDPDRLCIITEYLERGSLDKMLKEALKKGPMPDDVVLKIIRGVARGMNHLHYENIIHRDLAARNVLMSEAFEPKISDFGMSRFNREDKNKTANNVGPLRWMPPESIQDRLYSRYSDVWAYACFLIEVFTYEPPYPKMPILQFAMKLVSGEIKHVIPPNAPPLIQKIMRRAFSDEPEERGDFQLICQELDTLTTLYQ